MMLIAWSLTAVLFDQARNPPSTVSPSSTSSDGRLARAYATLTVAVERRLDLSDSFIRAMLAETAAIWNPLGVVLQSGDRGDAGPSAMTVNVIITDDPADGSSRTERLGWIHFLTPHDPEPIVYVSRFSARQLLDATSTLRQYPEKRRDMLLSRMLGRALAHELGHYLLASKGHTSYGLMRSIWPLEVLIADDRVGFGLPRAAQEVVSGCSRRM
jgi:hypothetical protein